MQKRKAAGLPPPTNFTIIHDMMENIKNGKTNTWDPFRMEE